MTAPIPAPVPPVWAASLLAALPPPDWMPPPLSPAGWVLALVAACVAGLSKAGLVGMGLISVLLMAEVFPARESTGMLLLLFVIADFMAAGYFRQHADWRAIGRLLPPALVGIGVGSALMGIISAAAFRPVMGWLVLVMLALQAARRWRRNLFEQVPHSRWFAWLMGFLMGVSTMMANAAGPVATLYLVARDFQKMAFVGTIAWFFLVINLTKVPFSAALGLITPGFVALALLLAPAILAGVTVGRRFVHRLDQKTFETVVLALTLIAALRLVVG